MYHERFISQLHIQNDLNCQHGECLSPLVIGIRTALDCVSINNASNVVRGSVRLLNQSTTQGRHEIRDRSRHIVARFRFTRPSGVTADVVMNINE
uniref:Uncharacterized protein n=1 Tax=Angiostrongylus cantonensis TaxID=6313 RepID=A0A0K0CZ80_ANGCA